jgi:hypothetical protein
MTALELPVATGAEAARVVRALGRHRYVAGREHLAHAFVFEALRDEDDPALAEAFAWSRALLADASVDVGSRDERLWRRASEAEVAAVLESFWRANARRPRERLRELLARAGVDVGDGRPFDEEREDEIFPVLVDAGWELAPLAALDEERHRGAIEAFGERILFESAKFEEQNAYEPVTPYLQELPAMGPIELLRGADDAGRLVEPLVLWVHGPEAYQDYVLRGVLRAAKIA